MKLPDQSDLVTEFKSIKSTIAETTSNSTTRFKLTLLPNDMFSSDMCKRALKNVISNIEQTREIQENIDNVYTELCDVIITEVNDKIPVDPRKTA